MTFTFYNEAQDRNYILVCQYKKLPSYCLWDETYIQKESISQRKKWWNTLNLQTNNANYSNCLNVISKWKIYYNQISGN